MGTQRITLVETPLRKGALPWRGASAEGRATRSRRGLSDLVKASA